MEHDTESDSSKPEAAAVTPWFNARQTPSRAGWYEVMWDPKYPGADGPGCIEKQYWLEDAFHHRSAANWQLVFIKTGLGDMPGDRWRGLHQPAAAPPMRKRSVR